MKGKLAESVKRHNLRPVLSPFVSDVVSHIVSSERLALRRAWEKLLWLMMHRRSS